MFIRTNPSLPLEESSTICRRIVDAVDENFPNELWAIHQMEVITKPPFTLLDIEKRSSKLLDWHELSSILNTFDDIINFKFSSYQNDIGMDVDFCNIVTMDVSVYVEFFDSTYWTVYSRNAKFLRKCLDILIQ